MAVDMDKLNVFIGKFVGDLGATVHAGMVVIGDKLGLYKALAEKPMTSAELATVTDTDERYLREWLSSQAAVATSNTTRRRSASAWTTSRHWHSPSRTAPHSFPARSSWRSAR
jgi:hypothetical protein